MKVEPQVQPDIVDEEDDAREAEDANKRAMRRTPQMQTALEVTAKLWDRQASHWSQLAPDPAPVDWAQKTKQISTQKKKQQKLSRKEALKAGPVTQCRAYVLYNKSDATTWKAALKGSEDAPNAQQDAFLRSVLRRCEVERLELSKSGAHSARQS